MWIYVTIKLYIINISKNYLYIFKVNEPVPVYIINKLLSHILNFMQLWLVIQVTSNLTWNWLAKNIIIRPVIKLCKVDANVQPFAQLRCFIYQLLQLLKTSISNLMR